MLDTHNNIIDMQVMGKSAKDAAFELAKLTTDQKNAALLTLAEHLDIHRQMILDANEKDLANAQAKGTDPIWIRDRLDLIHRLDGIIEDVRHVASLPDPVGEEYDERTLDSGITAKRRRVPIGVLGVIYESRPNVTIDISSLAFKTGNAVILRGGSDVLHTNLALADVLAQAFQQHNIPSEAVQYISSTDRKYVSEMLKMHHTIDMIIPRGGASLHEFCRQNSTIPVIIGGLGVCHLFVDSSADLDKSMPVILNAKTQRPAVCNSLDTLLVHETIASDYLPRVVAELGAQNVVFKAEPRALALLDDERVHPAGEDDFDTEWMGLTLGLKVVDDIDEAIQHIRQHATFHSDGILTEDPDHVAQFLNQVDSAGVFVNASTRFNDGGALGLGAEVAVSTQKLHARGPMALEELTTYKWIVTGDYTPRIR